MTQKIVMLLFVLLTIAATSAFAGFVGPGSNVSLTDVAAIKNMHDDDKVTLEGYIVKELRAEHYIFKDSSGEIEVEIDDEDFPGAKVTPATKIRIRGEVDEDRTSKTVDADYVDIVK